MALQRKGTAVRSEKIFLTGEKGVGKTTAIARFLAGERINPAGFRTVAQSLPTGAYKDGVYIVPYGDVPSAQAKTPPVAVRNKQESTFTAYPRVFDTVGVRILMDSRDAAFIVMDELGFMESEALDFQREIFHLLDGERPILGVVKAKRTPFLDEVRAHAAVTVLNVTAENRDSMPGMLAHLFHHTSNLKVPRI
jgi:nucleoside-triphosphatase